MMGLWVERHSTPVARAGRSSQGMEDGTAGGGGGGGRRSSLRRRLEKGRLLPDESGISSDRRKPGGRGHYPGLTAAGRPEHGTSPDLARAAQEATMRFGFFDDAAREYVITTPFTPHPWINYLGSEDFFGLISHTAGGYSFYRDPRMRRLTR